MENKPVVTRKGEGQYRVGRKRVIMRLYEIMCVKLLKIVKYYRT